MPAEAGDYEIARFNALRHGVLSRYTVLLRPYRETVKAALVHLDATQQFEKVIDAIQATPAETTEDMADLEQDEAMTRRALDLLGAGKADAYDAALTTLREDTRHWWEETCSPTTPMEEDQGHYTADAAGLLQFLEGEILPWYAMPRTELANRPLICAQAFGEALDPDRLERLGRYEVHLNRKLERMLTMLLRLKDCGRDGRGLIRLAKPQGMGPPGPISCRGAGRGTPPGSGRHPPRLNPTRPLARRVARASAGLYTSMIVTAKYRGDDQRTQEQATGGGAV